MALPEAHLSGSKGFSARVWVFAFFFTIIHAFSHRVISESMSITYCVFEFSYRFYGCHSA